jgi:hypothetical protein
MKRVFPLLMLSLLCGASQLLAQTEARAATDTLHVQLPPIVVIVERYDSKSGCFAPKVGVRDSQYQFSDYTASYFMHTGTLKDKGLNQNGVRQYYLQPEPHLWGTRMGTRDLLLFRY